MSIISERDFNGTLVLDLTETGSIKVIFPAYLHGIPVLYSKHHILLDTPVTPNLQYHLM